MAKRNRCDVHIGKAAALLSEHCGARVIANQAKSEQVLVHLEAMAHARAGIVSSHLVVQHVFATCSCTAVDVSHACTFLDNSLDWLLSVPLG